MVKGEIFSICWNILRQDEPRIPLNIQDLFSQDVYPTLPRIPHSPPFHLKPSAP